MKIYNITRIALIAIISLVTVSAFSVPAKKVWRTITLSNGQEIEAMLIGDEHGHWFVDRNNQPLRLDNSGRANYLTPFEFQTLKERRTQRLNAANERRQQRMEALRSKMAANGNGPHKAFGEPTVIKGQKKGIVILVNFSDKSMKSANPQQEFDDKFNKVGYNKSGHIGSVHDYFYDQSYGQFDLSFDVIGPVTVSKTHNYYGQNDYSGDDQHPAEMVIEALQLAHDQGVDFSEYDWNGDGEVDQVFCIFAGTGEASSGVDNDIWPHEWQLNSAAYFGDGTGEQVFDDVVIDTYAVSNELAYSNTLNGIGTACHEFAHCLGYADLYDIDYSGGQGMMDWDLMNTGSYNGPNGIGEVPAAFTSFERWWAGWMDLTELDSPQFINDMPAINDEPVAYVIYNDAHPDEYYLLENRQAKRWDSYTACNNDGTGHGMLILHVDYDKGVWASNKPNDDPKRQRMTFFPASNSYGTNYGGQISASYDQLAAHVFPGTKKVTSFTDTTKPAATLYNANLDGRKFMGKPITDISEKNGLISFTFMGGMTPPEAATATMTSSDRIDILWNEVPEAESYDLEVTEYEHKDIPAPILTETFAPTNKYSGDGSQNIGESMDNYTDNAGWRGSSCYTTVGGIKLGSSKNIGYALSPVMPKPEGGNVTVKLTVKSYNTDGTKPKALIVAEDGTTILAEAQECPSSTEKATYTLNFSNITQSFRLRFTCPAAGKRFYLYDTDVYVGTFSLEDIENAFGAAKAAAPGGSSTVIINGITDTFYTYTDIHSGMDYKFRVRAAANGHTSSWSDYVKVQTATAISTHALTTPLPSARIYNLNGQYVGKDASRLKPGIYVIEGKKVVMK